MSLEVASPALDPTLALTRCNRASVGLTGSVKSVTQVLDLPLRRDVLTFHNLRQATRYLTRLEFDPTGNLILVEEAEGGGPASFGELLSRMFHFPAPPVDARAASYGFTVTSRTRRDFDGERVVRERKWKRHPLAGPNDASESVTTIEYEGDRVVRALEDRGTVQFEDTFETDEAGRLTVITHDPRRCRPYHRTEFVYEGAPPRVVRARRHDDGRRVVRVDGYTYDERGRVASVTTEEPESQGSPEVTRYAFDDAGSVTQCERSAPGRPTSIMRYEFTYDAHGNWIEARYGELLHALHHSRHRQSAREPRLDGRTTRQIRYY